MRKQKTIYSKDYATFLDLLREVREKAGVSQIELAKRLAESQSFVSKCERGERRIDILELVTLCKALNIDIIEFTKTLVKRLKK